MKKAFLIILFIAAGTVLKAQFVSMNKSEISALKIDIDTSTSYKKVFAPISKTAREALNDTPNPIEKITSQGLLEGNPAKAASLKAVEDAEKVYALSLVYRLYGQKEYLNKAVEFLTAWAKINQATGDPIDETKLEDMITGYDLVRNEANTADRLMIDNWLATIAEAEINSASAKPGKGTAINNWNSHRIKIITLIAYTLHNEKYIAFVKPELEKQLAVNLNPDGTTFDYMDRDAFHYQTYDLEPLLTACIVIYRATGKNYFYYETNKGASLKKSVDFMIPYMTGQKTHGEFVNSKVQFDRARAENHEKGYEAGTLFKPSSGVYTLSLAAYFNASYLPVIMIVNKNDPSYFNWQLALNGIREKVAP